MKVNGKDDPISYGKIKNVPHHQPDINVINVVKTMPCAPGKSPFL